jgi:hypothetical protein
VADYTFSRVTDMTRTSSKAETFIQNFPIVQKINDDVEIDFSLTNDPLFTTNYFTVPLKGNKLFQCILFCPLIEGCLIEGEILAINKPIEYPVIPPLVPPQPVPQMLQVHSSLSLSLSLAFVKKNSNAFFETISK